MTVYRYIRQGRLPATRNGTEWRIRPADVKALERTLGGGRRRGSRRIDADCEGFVRRIVAGDSAGAWWLVESHLGGGLEPPGVLTELVVPALRAIGERWADGSVSVAEEHRATAAAQRVIGRLGLQFGRRGKDRGTIALAAPSGDLHTLPVAIVADLLRWRGFDVLELGANTPPEALGDSVRDMERLVAVGIVSTTRGLNAELASSVSAVNAAAPGVPVFMGGGAIRSSAHVLRLGGDVWTGSGANAAVDLVEQIAGSPERRAVPRVA
jgi:MerR family transcriptional regulator, light-induced transcriptional regulator